MTENKNVILFAVSLGILAISIGFLGVKVSDGLQNFRNYDRYVTMKGLAERDVKADLAVWPISYAATGNDLSALQSSMEAQGKTIISFLEEFGISQDEVELQRVIVQDLMAQTYRQNNALNNRYVLTQSYLVRTNKIKKINDASKNIGRLIKQGIVFSQNNAAGPNYLFTKLNELKPDMIAQATQNAKEGAAQFAKHSGQQVGDIKYASQGVFQILSRDRTYAVPEAQQINKRVRVVSTIQFYLED